MGLQMKAPPCRLGPWNNRHSDARRIGAAVGRVHVAHLPGGDKRDEHRPVLGAHLAAREEGVPSRRTGESLLVSSCTLSSLFLNRVGVELELPVFQEAGILQMLRAYRMTSASFDDCWMRQSCASSQGRKAAAIGSASSARAAGRISGAAPSSRATSRIPRAATRRSMPSPSSTRR